MSEHSPWWDMERHRRQLSRHLLGRGVELGPGHHPFPVPYAGADVAFVDRWVPEQQHDLFPEFGGQAPFPQPDVVANLDEDRLGALEDESQDFVIASHILEHVADPLGILHEVHRVLRNGGTALVLLPDRRRTFDQGRVPTTLDHVVSEFEAGVTAVDDDHIVEFLRDGVQGADYAQYLASSGDERQGLLERQRQRSIHAHCWQEDEFLEVLLYAIGELGHQWELVDGALGDDQGPGGYEFGWIMRKTNVGGLGAEARRERFAQTWATWVDDRRVVHSWQYELDARQAAPAGEVGALRAQVAQLKAELAAARTPQTWTVVVRDLAHRGARRARRLTTARPA